jgi:hypothetical protein
LTPLGVPWVYKVILGDMVENGLGQVALNAAVIQANLDGALRGLRLERRGGIIDGSTLHPLYHQFFLFGAVVFPNC